MELKRNSNAVYLLNYHLILITKYRKKVFINDTIVERTKEIMRNIAEDFECDIINQECGEDHIHLIISTKPTTELTKLVNLLKGTSSRYIRKEFDMTSEECATRFLKEEKVATVPGTAFGESGEGFLRISYAYSIDQLREAMERMGRFIEKLRNK